jgi:hypothetical protein
LLPAVVVPLKPCLAHSAHFVSVIARVSGSVAAEDEFVDSCAFGDAADVGDVGVQYGHPNQAAPGHAVPFQVAEVRDLMDEDVGIVARVSICWWRTARFGNA